MPQRLSGIGCASQSESCDEFGARGHSRAPPISKTLRALPKFSASSICEESSEDSASIRMARRGKIHAPRLVPKTFKHRRYRSGLSVRCRLTRAQLCIRIASLRTAPRARCTTSRLRSGRSDGAACSRVVLQGEGQLQGLLLAALHNLFPQLALVLHALQLRLDVLLRNLEEAQHGVVRLLRDHVQDVAEPLRAALAPRLVDAEGHVLRA